MPEEDLETGDLKEEIEKGLEQALEKEERERPRWTMYLSLSTAIIAVFAAVASLASGANSNEAILEKNDAVLNQSKASDQWAYYQAKGVKSSIAAGQAAMVAASNPTLPTLPTLQTLAVQLRGDADRQKAEQEQIEKTARSFESKVEESNARSEHFLGRHHRFALCVTLFQIAIALHAIAALTRRKPLWYVGLVPSMAGLGIFVWGLLGG